jgi:hypothetical protein
MQWARASRPSIGYIIADDGAEFSASSDKWSVWMQNGGPGIAIVEHYSYIVKFSNQPTSVPISLDEINRAMEARGLVDGVDYFVREHGQGAAYPPVSSYLEGPRICWFTIKALAELDGFDIVVRVRDALGDTHQRTLVIHGKMPSVALKATSRYLAARYSKD